MITRGLKGYSKQLARAKKEGRTHVHRRGWTTRGARQVKKVLGKSTWYKRKRSQEDADDDEHDPSYRRSPNKKRKVTKPDSYEDPMSLLFVERTEGGQLATKLRDMEPMLCKMTQGRVKIVEKNGRKLGQILVRKNPWAGQCSRKDCTVCQQENPPKKAVECKKRSITYVNTCLLCKKDGNRTEYIGESSRSVMERHGEHVEDASGKKKEDSHMWAHANSCHKGQILFQIQTIKTHKNAFMRQISETIEIKLRSRAGVHLLNSKTEYNRCLLPELSVQLGRNKQSEVEAGQKVNEEGYFDAGRRREEEVKVESKTNIMMEPDSKRRRRWKQLEQLKRMEDMEED